MKMRFILFLILTSVLATVNAAEYFPSHVGCLLGGAEKIGISCSETKNEFKRLKSLKPTARDRAIKKRANSFIKKKKFDYFSVLSLMVFPVKGREKILKRIQSLPGKRIHFSKIALKRIQSKPVEICQKKPAERPYFMMEICEIPLTK